MGWDDNSVIKKQPSLVHWEQILMAFFKDAAELDQYIGGVFREAGDHPESGPKLKAANIVLSTKSIAWASSTTHSTVTMSAAHELVIQRLRPVRR
jgi:hypothetical protein